MHSRKSSKINKVPIGQGYGILNIIELRTLRDFKIILVSFNLDAKYQTGKY